MSFLDEQEREIKVMCFSWNVGNAVPDAKELSAWIPANFERDPWDIVAVGTQENAFQVKERKEKEKKLKAGDLQITSANVSREDANLDDDGLEGLLEHSSQQDTERDAKLWDMMVAKRLGAGYAIAGQIAHWEMRLIVFARVKWLQGAERCINRVRTTHASTGIGGVLGNKGAVVVKFDFGSTSLCFVSCHLAAHAPKLLQRNQNCQQILSDTRKQLSSSLLDLGSMFDHLFWFGDLNYRLDLSNQHAEEASQHAAVSALVRQRDWATLLKYDQLRDSQAKGHAFAGFVDCTPCFEPTFKVARVVSTQYKDQRVPSYTDRVLYKSMPHLAAQLRLLSFRSFPEVSTSDHKPVAATFSLRCPPAVQSSHAAQLWPTSLLASPAGGGGADGGRASTAGDGSTWVGAAAFAPPPLLRINSLELSNLMDHDSIGGSDPYVIFFTNPPGLLADDRHAPCTVHKSAKSLRKLVSAAAAKTSAGAGAAAAAAKAATAALAAASEGDAAMSRSSSSRAAANRAAASAMARASAVEEARKSAFEEVRGHGVAVARTVPALPTI